MQEIINAAMAAIEAEKSESQNALQTHLTAVNEHLTAAVGLLQEKPKTEEASAEEVQKLMSNWY